jgi:hypothetical protein
MALSLALALKIRSDVNRQLQYIEYIKNINLKKKEKVKVKKVRIHKRNN